MNAPIDVTGICIQTRRLILRPWRQADLADFYAYASVPGVGEMAGWPHHTSIAESQKILDMFIREKKTLALEKRENGRVIGSLGLEEMHPDPEPGEKQGREIGYVLSREEWGQGLMPEAVQAVADYCFTALGWDYLTCGHFLGNAQSRRVIEKCGFRFFGEADFHTQDGRVEKTRNYVRYAPKYL